MSDSPIPYSLLPTNNKDLTRLLTSCRDETIIFRCSGLNSQYSRKLFEENMCMITHLNGSKIFDRPVSLYCNYIPILLSSVPVFSSTQRIVTINLADLLLEKIPLSTPTSIAFAHSFTDYVAFLKEQDTNLFSHMTTVNDHPIDIVNFVAPLMQGFFKSNYPDSEYSRDSFWKKMQSKIANSSYIVDANESIGGLSEQFINVLKKSVVEGKIILQAADVPYNFNSKDKTIVVQEKIVFFHPALLESILSENFLHVSPLHVKRELHSAKILKVDSSNSLSYLVKSSYVGTDNLIHVNQRFIALFRDTLTEPNGEDIFAI